MKLSVQVVRAAMGHASRELGKLPSRVRLEGAARYLSEEERLGLAYFLGVCNVLGTIGIDTSQVVLVLDDSES